MNKHLFFILLFSSVFFTGYTQKKYPCELEIDKKAQKLYDKARAAYSKGDKAKAKTYYKEAIEIQDDWAAPYYRLGLDLVLVIEKQPKSFEKNYPLAVTLKLFNYVRNTI